jgi:hypothetical protein
VRVVNPWLGIAIDSWMLALEASCVVGLRTLTMMTGGAPAAAEAQRMVTEKIDAALTLQAKLLSGGLGMSAPRASAHTLAHYRRKVRANRRRLTKP